MNDLEASVREQVKQCLSNQGQELKELLNTSQHSLNHLLFNLVQDQYKLGFKSIVEDMSKLDERHALLERERNFGEHGCTTNRLGITSSTEVYQLLARHG